MNDTTRRWQKGLCPCCGGPLDEHYDGTAPEPIAERVVLCGRCIANRHHDPETVAVILSELVGAGARGP